MGLFSNDIKSMDDLFVHMLRDMYYAEQQISNFLPKMIEKASDEELRQGFRDHLQETTGHIRNLEEVFRLLDMKPKGVECPAIDGIIKEANDVVGEADNKEVVDAALIAAAQAVEHYEITGYGTLITWAKQLNRDDCAELLKRNIGEEKAADEKLSKLAENRINQAAA